MTKQWEMFLKSFIITLLVASIIYAAYLAVQPPPKIPINPDYEGIESNLLILFNFSNGTVIP